ncbi:unnamed protein product, partial [Rotaria socialis]
EPREPNGSATYVHDSKQLTEERRSSIFAEYEKHNNHLGFILKVLSPHMISTSMLRRYVFI